MKSSQKSILVFGHNDRNILDQIEANFLKRQCFIGKYKIQSELGSGAFAKVYKCFSNQDHKDYALKVYSYIEINAKFNDYQKNKLLESINQEAKLMQECKSPHIVKCYETIQFEYYKILVLQYCLNRNLWEYLIQKGQSCQSIPRSKSLRQPQAARIITQVSLGLIQLHKNNIIHRDLKLQNIMVKNGICKIIDLGLSRKLESQSCLLSTNAGTELTKAPQIKNNKPYGLKADIFSLGVIYLMLISNCQFEKRTAHNFYNNRDILFNKGLNISKESLDFINRTLEVNPNQRMSWREILNHDLFKNMKVMTQSEIVQIEQNFRNQLNHAGVIVLDCNSSLIPKSTYNKASIFVEDEEVNQLPQLPPIQQKTESFEYRDYPEEVRVYCLNCKKAEFILLELIENIEKLNDKSYEREMESCHILLFLLSTEARSLVLQAQRYCKVNYYIEFLKQVNDLHQAIETKFQFYQSILKSLLKCVRNAFIQNELLKNYEPLKYYLNFQKEITSQFREQSLNLIVYYIKKLIKAGLFNQKVKSRLCSFRKVMKITLEDLRMSDFETKVCQIRLMYTQ